MTEQMNRKQAELIAWLADKFHETVFEIRTGRYEFAGDSKIFDLVCEIDDFCENYAAALELILVQTPVQNWAEKLGREERGVK